MNVYSAYQGLSFCATRVDMLISLYDAVIERIERALALTTVGDDAKAIPDLVRAQRLMVELVGGLDRTQGELPYNLARLFLFVIEGISSRRVDSLQASVRVMKTLREGIMGIRAEAVRLEHEGRIPPVDANSTVRLSA